MPAVSFPTFTQGMSVAQLSDQTARLTKEVQWLVNGNLDSYNVRNIAGYKVDRYTLKHQSGIVGMSGADPTVPTAIRFWAGNEDPTAAPFRVQQNGTLYATDGNFQGYINASTINGSIVNASTINGGVIRGTQIYGSYIATAEGGALPRSEMSVSGNMFAVYYEDESWIKMQAAGGTLPRMLYHYYGSEASMFFYNAILFHIFYLQSTAEIDIQSSEDIRLIPGTGKHVIVDDWTKIKGSSGTLQSVFDGYDSSIASINSNISSIWSAISSLDARVTALGG